MRSLWIQSWHCLRSQVSSIHACWCVGDVVAVLFAGADITEVEHMANVEVSQLKFEGAVSGSKMGFMVLLLLVG